MENMLFDFHSHILPKMDDGSLDVKMSLDMLSSLEKQGAYGVYCTSHFLLSHESVCEFLKRRQNAYDELMEYISINCNKGPVEIRLGAEIMVCSGLAETELSTLVLEKSNALLLELPRERLSRQTLKEIYNLCSARGYIPIIAHIDRYEWFRQADFEALLKLPDVVFGFNAEALSRRSTRKTVLGLIDGGVRILFGTDTHNLSDRAPDFNLLTGKGGPSPLSSKERSALLDAHLLTQRYIFSDGHEKHSGLFF